MAWTNKLEVESTIQKLIPSVEEDLLTVEQVKLITQLSQATIYHHAAKGMFPAPIKVGGANRWLRGEIVDYLMQRVLERNARMAAKQNPGNSPVTGV
jgi:predicted DNA-binding transcriptional regulator AlpA